MNDTACGKDCPFVKQGFCSSDSECPNHMVTWWIEGDNQTPKKINDCSPKRMLLQQQVLQTKMEGVQQALEQSRNQYNQLCVYLKSLINMSRTALKCNSTEENVKSIDDHTYESNSQ